MYDTTKAKNYNPLYHDIFGLHTFFAEAQTRRGGSCRHFRVETFGGAIGADPGHTSEATPRHGTLTEWDANCNILHTCFEQLQ